MDLKDIIEKIYSFYPPDPSLYKNEDFYKSANGQKIYETWELQNEDRDWSPFIDDLNKISGLDLISIYRGSEFCLKAYGDFTNFSADINHHTTLVVSVSTMIPFHCIYVTPANVFDKKRTFFDGTGNSVEFVEPCFSQECREIHKFLKKTIDEPLLKYEITDEGIRLIREISAFTGRHFKTQALPLEFLNIRLDNIAVEDSFVGDVNIYTAAFTPHVL
jgi:hypothetical protein